MVPCGVPAAIKSIPAGIPQLSDPSLRYSRNSHTHTRGKPHLQHLFIFSRSAGVLSEKSAEGSCTLLTFTRIFIRNCSRDVTLRCYFQYQHICTHTRLTALFFRDYPGQPVQKGNPNLHFTEARDSEWQWHQLGHMQVCNSLQTDNHTSTPTAQFLQAGCPS